MFHRATVIAAILAPSCSALKVSSAPRSGVRSTMTTLQSSLAEPLVGPSCNLLPADYGFDPMKFADKDLHLFGATNKNRDSAAVLMDYRDSEIRHGRLAMLAALAWPVQELLSPTIARAANHQGLSGLSDLLTATAGRNPSVLNGGLGMSTVPFFLVATAAAIGALDMASLRIREDEGDAYVPGDFAFDPLCLLKGASPKSKIDMQEKEINNGRLAMVAMLVYVVEEALFKAPIVQITPQLFTPLIASPSFVQQLDSLFSVASAAQRISGDEVLRFFGDITL